MAQASFEPGTSRSRVLRSARYATLAGTRTATLRPHLGVADHLVLLSPKYRPLGQRQEPMQMVVNQWHEDAVRVLQVSLEC